MTDHDHPYKLLFSHPEMVRDLLLSFVKEDWVSELDLSTLEKANSSFVSDDLREREGDVVWRVQWAGKCLYVYILIEFQSRSDPFMAVRIMTYIGLLYQDLVRTGKVSAGDKLPPVLPLVLYNGSPLWTAAQNVAELIEAVPGSLAKYQPHLQYLLIDEGRYRDSDLEPVRNAVSALFRLEKSRNPEDIRAMLQLLAGWLQAPEQSSLRRAFTVWFARSFFPARVPGVSFPEFHDLQEVNAMLSETVVEWTKTWKEEGIKEGERKATLKIAKSLLSAGIPIEKIVELTELPQEEIEKLKI